MIIGSYCAEDIFPQLCLSGERVELRDREAVSVSVGLFEQQPHVADIYFVGLPYSSAWLFGRVIYDFPTLNTTENLDNNQI